MPNKVFGTVLAHSMRGKMLSRGEFQTLAESRDIQELVTRMKNTRYVDTLGKLGEPLTAEKVDSALREHLINAHAKMMRIAGDAEVLDAYFLKYIIWNLKIILKGKALGKSYDDLLPKINLRAEELTGRRDVVVRALVAKDFEEAVNSLAGSAFGQDAAKAHEAYKASKDIRVFDTYLDHAFFATLDRSLYFESRLHDVQKIVGGEVDAYNTLAVLRGKFWGLEPEAIRELIVATTTKVTEGVLQNMMSAEKIREAMGELANTGYKDIVPDGAASDIDAIVQLEKGFEEVSLRLVTGAYRTVFSLGNMLASLKLLALEIRNLAAVVTGVEQKIPPDRIMENLVFA
jgi:V/A-type H+-transporting ATPase subunit C